MFDLNKELSKDYGTHRAGWSYAINGLASLHNESAPELISFAEKKFIFGSEQGDFLNNYQPPKKNWVGFIHVPVHVPDWFNRHYSPEELLKTEHFNEALNNCVGLISLSTPLTNWLRRNLNVPVETILHPTEMVDKCFDTRALTKEKIKVVQLGFWLRKLHAINMLDLDASKFTKITVGISKKHQNKIVDIEREIFGYPRLKDSCINYEFLNDDSYDNLLSNSVVFVDFYDTSANNAIVECIARNTPVVCPPLKAVVDYLGEDYPLYFNSYDEASKKLNDIDLLVKASEYIKNSGIKENVSMNTFINNMSKLRF